MYQSQNPWTTEATCPTTPSMARARTGPPSRVEAAAAPTRANCRAPTAVAIDRVCRAARSSTPWAVVEDRRMLEHLAGHPVEQTGRRRLDLDPEAAEPARPPGERPPAPPCRTPPPTRRPPPRGDPRAAGATAAPGRSGPGPGPDATPGGPERASRTVRAPTAIRSLRESAGPGSAGQTADPARQDRIRSLDGSKNARKPMVAGSSRPPTSTWYRPSASPSAVTGPRSCRQR